MQFTSAIVFDIERMSQRQPKGYKATKDITKITTAHNKHHHLTIDHAFILRTQLHPIHPSSPFLDPNPPIPTGIHTPPLEKKKIVKKAKVDPKLLGQRIIRKHK
jgi:hypothetical protein